MTHRFRCVLVSLGGVLALALPASAEPTPDALRASLSCRPQASPGRVLCEVELEVAQGRLRWGDALVTAAPRFVRPLRSRVGPRQASGQEPTRMRLPIALVATASGKGRLDVRARAVVCSPAPAGAELCLPRALDVHALVHVGPIREP